MKYAVYFGSRALYQDMIPAAKSLLKHSDVDVIYLLSEDDEFPYELPSNVVNINVGKQLTRWFREGNPNWSSNWTPIGLIRVALSKVFPDIDRILTIDCDTIVVDDVSDLWDVPIDGKYFAGVKEPVLSGRSNGIYVNAGVVMLNLDKIRQDGKDDEMIDLLNAKKLYFVAQDAMNHCCRYGIVEIPSEYNSCAYTAPVRSPKIYHFAGSRHFGWRNQPIYQKYVEMPWCDVRAEYKDICG